MTLGGRRYRPGRRQARLCSFSADCGICLGMNSSDQLRLSLAYLSRFSLSAVSQIEACWNSTNALRQSTDTQTATNMAVQYAGRGMGARKAPNSQFDARETHPLAGAEYLGWYGPQPTISYGSAA